MRLFVQERFLLNSAMPIYDPGAEVNLQVRYRPDYDYREYYIRRTTITIFSFCQRAYFIHIVLSSPPEPMYTGRRFVLKMIIKTKQKYNNNCLHYDINIHVYKPSCFVVIFSRGKIYFSL